MFFFFLKSLFVLEKSVHFRIETHFTLDIIDNYVFKRDFALYGLVFKDNIYFIEKSLVK